MRFLMEIDRVKPQYDTLLKFHDETVPRILHEWGGTSTTDWQFVLALPPVMNK